MEREIDILPVTDTQDIGAQEIKGDGITRFTPEARKALEEAGFMIFELQSKSVNDLRGEGLTTKGPVLNNSFDLPSMHSEVALDLDLIYDITKNSTGRLSTRRPVSTSRILPTKFYGKGSRDRNRNSLAITYLEGLPIDSDEIDVVIGNIADWTQILLQHRERTGEFLFGKPRTDMEGFLSSNQWIGTEPRLETNYSRDTFVYNLLRWKNGFTPKNQEKSIEFNRKYSRRRPGEIIPLVVPSEQLVKMGRQPTERIEYPEFKYPEEEAPPEAGDIRYATSPEGIVRRVLIKQLVEDGDKLFANCYLLLEDRRFATNSDVSTSTDPRTGFNDMVQTDLFFTMDASQLSSVRNRNLSKDEIEILEQKAEENHNLQKTRITQAQINHKMKELEILQKIAMPAFADIFNQA